MPSYAERVEIYKRPEKSSRKNLESYLAHMPEVQEALGDAALYWGARAEAKLAEHRFTGHSKIDIEHHKTDYLIVLDDEGYHMGDERRPGSREISGPGAMSIMEGRKPRPGNRGMEGLHLMPRTMKGFMKR